MTPAELKDMVMSGDNKVLIPVSSLLTAVVVIFGGKAIGGPNQTDAILLEMKKQNEHILAMKIQTSGLDERFDKLINAIAGQTNRIHTVERQQSADGVRIERNENDIIKLENMIPRYERPIFSEQP